MSVQACQDARYARTLLLPDARYALATAVNRHCQRASTLKISFLLSHHTPTLKIASLTVLSLVPSGLFTDSPLTTPYHLATDRLHEELGGLGKKMVKPKTAASEGQLKVKSVHPAVSPRWRQDHQHASDRPCISSGIWWQ